MNCFKIKNTCGTNTYATCVIYEGEVSQTSDLKDQDCLDIQQVAEDLYSITDNIKEQFELESLRGECISYASGTLTIPIVLAKFQELICSMQTTINTQANTISALEQRVEDLEQNICN